MGRILAEDRDKRLQSHLSFVLAILLENAGETLEAEKMKDFDKKDQLQGLLMDLKMSRSIERA